MTAEQFCYWLQGFAELGGDNHPTHEQWKSINDHLSTVFVKITPPVKSPVTTVEEALRRYRESEQRLPNPYAPNIPYLGHQPVITC